MSENGAVDQPELAGRKILVVDGDWINGHILAGILHPAGFDVIPASSGEAALELYSAEPPDLILLDVRLPGMDGFEMCRALRQRVGEACAPVIFITALNDSDDIVKGFAAGGVDYLPKPFRPNEVLARIRLHLHNRQLAEQQRLMLDELRIANAAKNKVLGMAAHDLRNPMGTIRALAEFLQDDVTGTLTPEQRELVEVIREASDGMLAVVNKLIEPSVMELSELKLELQKASLTELLEKEVALHNINAARKNSRIELQTTTAPIHLTFDPSKLRQVVGQVLGNAIKFSPPQSVITVAIDSTAKGCTVAFRDQGPGMPVNEHSAAAPASAPSAGGPAGGTKSPGLGLAICRRIMHAHGGSVSSENLTFGGCMVRITLPTA